MVYILFYNVNSAFMHISSIGTSVYTSVSTSQAIYNSEINGEVLGYVLRNVPVESLGGSWG